MKKQLGMVLAAVVFLMGFSIVTSAQEFRRNHNINARQERQDRRIYQGIGNRSAAATEYQDALSMASGFEPARAALQQVR